MKLYYTPGACSIGIHVLLEEIGTPYETELVQLAKGEQHGESFIAVNPKSKVPVLRRDDGSVLTEYGAIATWLARTNPAAALLPADPEAEARMMEAVEYVTATVHMQGFTRIARPGNFSPNEADVDAVRARGREIYRKGLGVLDHALDGREWIAGAYSIADSALFYVSRWSVRAEVTLPSNVAAHLARMRDRPAVQRTLAAEGLEA